MGLIKTMKRWFDNSFGRKIPTANEEEQVRAAEAEQPNPDKKHRLK
jgi:hypothetical protein